MDKEKKSKPEKPLIKVTDLRKVYRLGKEKVVALNGVSFEIKRGEICCLLGTSGSGKSTLLNMLAGLEKPTKGTIVIDNAKIHTLNEKKLAIFRQKNMGFVFQSYNLLTNLTALDNVALPLAFRGIPKVIRSKKAKIMLKKVGLGQRYKHRPTQMSGGQQQRVGIARAFVAKPQIVFADEPTGNLDSRTTIEVMEMMVEMARKNNQTLIIVTHDKEISEYSDKVFHIIDGNIDKMYDNIAKDKKEKMAQTIKENAEIADIVETINENTQVEMENNGEKETPLVEATSL